MEAQEVWEEYPPSLIAYWYEEETRIQTEERIFNANCHGARMDMPKWEEGEGVKTSTSRLEEAKKRYYERKNKPQTEKIMETVDIKV